MQFFIWPGNVPQVEEMGQQWNTLIQNVVSHQRKT